MENGRMTRLLAMHPLGVPHVERAGLPFVLQVVAVVLLIGLVAWGVADLTGWRRWPAFGRSSRPMPRQPWLAADRALADEGGDVLVANRGPSPPHPRRRHRPLDAAAVMVDRWLARARSSLGWGGDRRPIVLRQLRVEPLASRSLPPAREATALVVIEGEVVVRAGGEAVASQRWLNAVERLPAEDRAFLVAGDAVFVAPSSAPSLASGRSGAVVAVVEIRNRKRRILPARLALSLVAALIAYVALPNIRFLEVSADFMPTADSRHLALLGEVFTILVGAGAALVVAAPGGAAVAFLGAVAAGSALAVYPYLPNRIVYSAWPNAVVWLSLPLALALAALVVRHWEQRVRSRSRGAPREIASETDLAAISWSLHDG